MMRIVALGKLRKTILAAVLLGSVIPAGIALHTTFAAAGACTAPATDYGTVTEPTTTITGAGTYRIWTRMSAPDTTNNTYMLQIDGTSCYTIGGTGVPTYANGAVTFFTSGGSNWTDKTSAGAVIDVSLTAGSHSFVLIGNAPGVVVDRLVLTQDTTCVPTGTGDNCANPPDTTPPVVSITSPANNATISTATTVTANATDDVAINKVEFYVDGTLKGTDTTGSANNYTYSLNPTTLSVGAHSMYAIAYDTSTTGNPTTSGTINFTVADTTPPTISAVTVSSITQTGATITWTTNEAADSQVKYGATASYGSQTTTADTSPRVTSHSVSVTGLTAGTTYHYQVVSKDASGNAGNSSDATFTTQSAAGDTTAPTVSITAPTSGSTVKGKMNLTASASDNVGVVGVQFKLDGVNLGAEDTASPYTLSWTPAVFSGSHTITAVARDAAGNTTTATTINFTINVQAADIDVSGAVDFLDLSALAGQFGRTGAAITVPRANITNTDGLNTVNFLDLSALASKYGT